MRKRRSRYKNIFHRFRFWATLVSIAATSTFAYPFVSPFSEGFASFGASSFTEFVNLTDAFKKAHKDIPFVFDSISTGQSDEDFALDAFSNKKISEDWIKQMATLQNTNVSNLFRSGQYSGSKQANPGKSGGASEHVGEGELGFELLVIPTFFTALFSVIYSFDLTNPEEGNSFLFQNNPTAGSNSPLARGEDTPPGNGGGAGDGAGGNNGNGPGGGLQNSGGSGNPNGGGGNGNGFGGPLGGGAGSGGSSSGNNNSPENNSSLESEVDFATATETPEPATVALFSIGLAGYGFRRLFK